MVRRIADRHRNEKEIRERKRRVQRLKRIAALNPLEQSSQERVDKFTVLANKYGKAAAAIDVEKEAAANAAERNFELDEQGAAPVDVRGDDDDLSPVTETPDSEEGMYHGDIVDTLDVVDPGIGTVSNLQNIGAAILLPPIFQRKTVMELPTLEMNDAPQAQTRARADADGVDQTDGLSTISQISDVDDKLEDMHLDLFVKQVLTRKQKFRRAMSGLWVFLKTPMGIFAAIYGFLVVFSGAALVLFLAGWIDHGNNKDYWVEVFSQMVNALFTITGVGLIPWRVMDTYYIVRIAHYQHLTWRLRRERGMPKLADRHDIPSVARGADGQPLRMETEEHIYPPDAVLLPRQSDKLHELQTRLSKSQSWYRAHTTPTHYAFPISLGLAIVILNDLNSVFQCLLCGVMWGYATHYKDRPAWTTGSLIPLSFLCGIGAGVLTWVGSERTKRKWEVEERLLEAFKFEVEQKIHQKPVAQNDHSLKSKRESSPEEQQQPQPTLEEEEQPPTAPALADEPQPTAGPSSSTDTRTEQDKTQ